jgi:hypothetical protein
MKVMTSSQLKMPNMVIPGDGQLVDSIADHPLEGGPAPQHPSQ